MASSLQEQLLKAGLIDQARLDKAKRQKKKDDRQQRKAAPSSKAKTSSPAQRQDPAKVAKDRELNAQRDEGRLQRELAAQISQLIARNRYPRTESDDDRAFHFDNKGKLKRIFVSADTHRKITEGKLVIVNHNGVFELVAPQIADKIRRRNPSLVIDLPKEETPDEDDPYAAYKVPDDLVW